MELSIQHKSKKYKKTRQ